LRNQWDENPAISGKTITNKKNTHQWALSGKDELKSTVDSIDHKAKSKNYPIIYEDHEELRVPKKDHFINNIFLQSQLQDRFEDQKKKEKAPWSHNAFNKNIKSSKYMVEGRPLFEGYGSHVHNISSGRARTFYSSNVF